MIKYLRDYLVSEEIEIQSACRIKEMTLGQQVIHHILYEKEIPIHFLEAQVVGNMVNLYGVANSQSLVEAALQAAKEVAATETVQSDIQVVQEYSVMP
jgi:hypothetical protein